MLDEKEELRDGPMGLRGDRNQCRGCMQYFNSTFAFDKHRTGRYGKERRCRTIEEMQSLGMIINASGFWVSGVNYRLEQTTAADSREATEGCREGNPTGATPPNVPPQERLGEGTTADET
jgi:hypothetical protein